MPYPISINKNVTVDLDRNSIINGLTEDLNKVGTETEIKDNKVKMTRCTEFSSGKTSFKEFNNGDIELDLTSDKAKVHFRIFLVEHLVIFLVALAIGAYGFFDEGLRSVMIKISIIILTANFVFCYLFPLMALNSFIQDFTNRTKH